MEYSPTNIRAAIASASSRVLESAPLDLRIALIDTLEHAIDDAYVLVIAAGALQVVFALFLKREKYDTGHLSPGA